MKKIAQVTVVTAAYRAANMDLVMESVLQQDVPPARHVIVNDGKPEVHSWYESMHLDGVLFVDLSERQRRAGLYSRNIGAVLARTPYVAFLDDDCHFAPNHLSSLLEKAESTGKIAFSNMVVRAYSDGREVQRRRCRLVKDRIDHGCLLWPRDIFLKYGMFRDEETMTYDWALINRVLQGEGEDAFRSTDLYTFFFGSKKH